MVILTKEMSTKIVNYMTPSAGVLVSRRDHIVEMPYFFSSSRLQWGLWIIIVNMHYLLLYQYTAHYFLLYLGITMLFSYTIVDFNLFYYEAAAMQI